jgi:hypothetical protein
MTRAAIISTTINAMPNMDSWAMHMSSDDAMIITGDLKSPHSELEERAHRAREEYGLDIRYLPPVAQERWRSSEAIGWNCIQRRNIAILEALELEPTFIVTIDDDNYPIMRVEDDINATWLDLVTDVLANDAPPVHLTHSASGWFNPGLLCSPTVTHRGFPLDQRHKFTDISIGSAAPRPVGVFAALWYGDPDIDAVERIATDPQVEHVQGQNVTLANGTWAPFNSQATAYRAAFAPLMMCLPGVGRMDDIWASYVARAVMDHLGWHVQYGNPTVRQDRNAHNLVRDLRDEMLGYEHNMHLCDTLRAAELPETPFVDELLASLLTTLSRLPYVPSGALRAYEAWLSDLLQIDNGHASARLFDTTKIGYQGE